MKEVKKKVLRFKKVTCRTCEKTIRRFDRSKFKGYHVPASDILAAIRRHYKRNHPHKFRESTKKGLKTKKKEKKRGARKSVGKTKKKGIMKKIRGFYEPDVRAIKQRKGVKHIPTYLKQKVKAIL